MEFELADPHLIVEDRIAAAECGPVIEYAVQAELGVRPFLQPPAAPDVLVCEPPVYDVGEVGKVGEEHPMLFPDKRLELSADRLRWLMLGRDWLRVGHHPHSGSNRALIGRSRLVAGFDRSVVALGARAGFATLRQTFVRRCQNCVALATNHAASATSSA